MVRFDMVFLLSFWHGEIARLPLSQLAFCRDDTPERTIVHVRDAERSVPPVATVILSHTPPALSCPRTLVHGVAVRVGQRLKG